MKTVILLRGQTHNEFAFEHGCGESSGHGTVLMGSKIGEKGFAHGVGAGRCRASGDGYGKGKSHLSKEVAVHIKAYEVKKD